MQEGTIIKLSFLGAAGTVTGSKYLLEHHQKKVLIDCGLFQGLKELRLRNWHGLAISPREVHAVYLTHAHIDHSGYLPIFVREGFDGPIYASEATRQLCGILLPDSGRIHEEDAARANRLGYSKHKPALPLYTEADAYKALERFESLDFGTSYKVADDWTLQLSRSGHILGSAFLRFQTPDASLVFSGDLGRPNDPLMNPPATVQDTDYLVLDSTYGDRLHPQNDDVGMLADIITKTAKQGGTVLIPAFAVGRTQALLYLLDTLKEDGRIPDLPIYLDSPMAQDASDLFCRHPKEHKLGPESAHKVCAAAQYTRSVEESKAIHQSLFPKIVISASGMAEGGRVLHHIAHYAPQHHNAIVFSGFQAPGTRGDRLVRGEQLVKMLGTQVPIRARVLRLEGLSSHADYNETLDWLQGLRRPPAKIFLTHGSPSAAQTLKQLIEERFGWDVHVAQDQESVDL